MEREENQMRLFFAIMLPDAVREAVAREQERWRSLAGDEGLRWTLPEQWHLTLKFLGDTPDTALPLLVEAAHKVAARFAPFSLALADAGVFPNPRSPQVFWMGVGGDVPVLTRLAESLEEALAERGFAPETHPFRPHLTLARARTRTGETSLAQALAAQKNTSKEVDIFTEFVIQCFVLMSSELQPEGARYTPVQTFALTDG